MVPEVDIPGNLGGFIFTTTATVLGPLFRLLFEPVEPVLAAVHLKLVCLEIQPHLGLGDLGSGFAEVITGKLLWHPVHPQLLVELVAWLIPKSLACS